MSMIEINVGKLLTTFKSSFMTDCNKFKETISNSPQIWSRFTGHIMMKALSRSFLNSWTQDPSVTSSICPKD